jgi:hypothetical protein
MPNEFSGIERRLDELNDIVLFAEKVRLWLTQKEK